MQELEETPAKWRSSTKSHATRASWADTTIQRVRMEDSESEEQRQKGVPVRRGRVSKDEFQWSCELCMGTEMVFSAKTQDLLNIKRTNHMANFHKKHGKIEGQFENQKGEQGRVKGTGLTRKGNPTNKIIGMPCRRYGGLIERIQMTEAILLSGRGEEIYWTCPWCRMEMATPQIIRRGRSYQADFSKRFHLDECEMGGKGKSLNDARIEQLRLGIGKQQTMKQRGYRPGAMGLISKTSRVSLKKRKETMQRRVRAIKARPAACKRGAKWREQNIKEREEGDLIIRTKDAEEIYRKKKSECNFTFETLCRNLDDKALEERRQWANRKLRIWLTTTELQNTKCRKE